MQKVFYSWQSDNSRARNKFKRALEIAVRQIGEDLEEADRPELDSDTQGTFASVDITKTIFKKIDECAVFVADVTPIAEVDDKLIPNPNVMAELGYALKTKNEYSLFVYCYDGERPERSMPFDIGGNKLLRVLTTDKPVEIAKELTWRIQGMLATADTSAEKSDFPHIYICGGGFHQSSTNIWAEFNVRNAEAAEYTLTAIEIEGKSAEPFKSLKAGSNTGGIVLNGVSEFFENADPLIKMTVQLKGKKYHLEQRILTAVSPDGRNRFERYSELPVLAHA